MLEKLQLEPALAHAVPCRGVISRWQGPRLVDRPGVLDPDGCGWIVDRVRFDAAVLEKACATAGVEWIIERAHGATPHEGGWQVLVGSREVSCRRLVLATGRGSRFPARTGALDSRGRRMVAVVAWVADRLPGHDDQLFVDAAPDGWWSGLTTDEGTALSFCTDVDLLRREGGRAAATWHAALPSLGWDAASGVRPWLRPAATGGYSGSPAHGLDVIGDAAYAADPLSGQGLALALTGAERASADPFAYAAWAAERSAEHAGQEAAVYAAAAHFADQPFWRRRLSDNGVSDQARRALERPLSGLLSVN